MVAATAGELVCGSGAGDAGEILKVALVAATAGELVCISGVSLLTALLGGKKVLLDLGEVGVMGLYFRGDLRAALICVGTGIFVFLSDRIECLELTVS